MSISDVLRVSMLHNARESAAAVAACYVDLS